MVHSAGVHLPARYTHLKPRLRSHSVHHAHVAAARLALLMTHPAHDPPQQVFNKAGGAINALVYHDQVVWAGIEDGIIWRCGWLCGCLLLLCPPPQHASFFVTPCVWQRLHALIHTTPHSLWRFAASLLQVLP